MHCDNCFVENTPLCIVRVFIPGVNANGGRQTVDVARLCDACIRALLEKEITITVPDAIPFSHLWDTL